LTFIKHLIPVETMMCLSIWNMFNQDVMHFEYLIHLRLYFCLYSRPHSTFSDFFSCRPSSTLHEILRKQARLAAPRRFLGASNGWDETMGFTVATKYWD